MDYVRVSSMRTLSTLIMLAFLSACARPVWVKPGASQSDFSSDRYACLQESQQRFAGLTINASGGAAVDKSVTNDQLFSSCMNARGWYLQRQAADQLQSSTQPQSNPLKEALDAFTAAGRARCQEPQLQAYFAKTACVALDMTLSQLTDTSMATNPEKVALQLNRNEYIEASRKYIQAIRQYGGAKGSTIATIREKSDEDVDALVLDLYSGKIAWGEFNRRRKEINVKLRDAINSVNSH
jgi:hypothetical protein